MNRVLSWFCKIFLQPIVGKLLIKETRGWENIPKGNFILAANHQSHLDEIATAYLCVPRRFHFIGQTDSFKGLGRIFIHIFYFITGVIPIDRKSEESRKKVIKEAIRVLKKGDVLIIYPEGTRTRTGEMGEGKFGVARIFLETGVPILPVAVEGTFELMPPGKKPKIKKVVKINIGKPLYFKEELERIRKLGWNSEENKQILIKITDKLMRDIASLKSEID